MHQTLICSAPLISNTLHFSRLKQWSRNPFKVFGSYLPWRLVLTCYKSLTLPLGELLSWQGWVTTRLTSHITCHITQGPHIRSWPVSTGNWGARAGAATLAHSSPDHSTTTPTADDIMRARTDSRGLLIFYFDQHTENTDHPRSTISTRFRTCMNVNFSDLTSVNCSYSIWVCVCIVLD